MQNVGIRWVPSSGVLNRYLGIFVFQNSPNGAPGLTDLIIHRDTSFMNIDLEFCVNLKTLSFPELASMQGTPIRTLVVTGCPVLTSISMPVLGACGTTAMNNNPSLVVIDASSLAPDDSANLDFSGNALNQATVDLILHRCVLKVTWAQSLNLGGGTSSAPSAAGLVDKAILQGRGAGVTTN